MPISLKLNKDLNTFGYYLLEGFRAISSSNETKKCQVLSCQLMNTSTLKTC